MRLQPHIQAAGQWLRKPYYVFQPTQLIKRIRSLGQVPPASHELRLPWGATVVYSPREDIGRALWTTGVYEIAVTEVLWRLTDPGDVVVDAGAHIGYMTSVLASRVGPGGRVHAFEPHPALYEHLLTNVATWRRTLGWTQIDPSMLALSSRSGKGVLYAGESFEHNSGTASLVNRPPESPGLDVALTTLDEVLGDHDPIGVLKVDVEGHEHDVLCGAARLLGRRMVRDIVFEAWDGNYGAVELLRGFGYHVFRLQSGLLKPHLRSTNGTFASRWEPPNYVATVDLRRCLTRLAPLGWRSLTRKAA